MWSSSSSSRPIGYNNLMAPEIGMVGLRDVFVVAPPSSFHQQHESIGSADATTALGVGVSVGIGVLPLLPSHAPMNIGVEEGSVMMSHFRGGGGGRGLTQYHRNDIDLLGLGFSSDPSSGIAGTCHDCGNQAKKDCVHKRCRSCCKSRGFNCSTHVRSTWVPAARRREKQMPTNAAAGTSSGSTSCSKKPRLFASQATTNSHTSTSNTPSRSFDTTSTHQDMSFKEAKKLPDQIRAPAVFKCVRVTAVEDGGDEYAYQAVVKIGGHIFKGYLYDNGVESRDHCFPTLPELHLGGGDGASTSSPIIDPTNVYASSGGGGPVGGSSYGNPIN